MDSIHGKKQPRPYKNKDESVEEVKIAPIAELLWNFYYKP